MAYQRIDSLSEQIQPIFGVKVSNHIAGHDRSVLAFSYSKSIKKCSAVRFRASLTPLQVRSWLRFEAGGLEELWERNVLRAARFPRRINQFVPALAARWEVIEIDRHVGDIIREGAETELDDDDKSMNRAGRLRNTCSWRY